MTFVPLNHILNAFKIFRMKNLFIVLAFLCFQNVVFGQGWQKILTDTIRPSTATNAFDGGYVIAGQAGRSNFQSVLKVNAKGNKQWIKIFPDFTLTSTPTDFPLNIIQTPDSAFLLHGADQDNAYIVKKLDQQGNTIWSKKIPLDYAKLKPNKNEYVLIGKSRTLSSYVLLKLNLNGDTISQKQIQLGRFFDFDIQKDGILAVHFDGSQVIKYDFNGQILSQKTVVLSGFNIGWKRLIRTKDSSYYIGNNDTLLYKISKQGDILWKKQVTYYDYALTNDDGIIGTNIFLITNGSNIYSSVIIEKFNKLGNSIWKKQFINGSNDSPEKIIACTNGGTLILVNSYNNGYPVPLLIKIDDDGLVNPANLDGKIIKDIDKNCRFTTVDKPFYQSLVVAKNDITGETIIATTDTTGRYNLNLDTTRYTIQAYPLNNRNLWQSCTPSVSKTFSSTNRTDSLDFALKSIVDCPSMAVNITTPVLRRCFNNTYTVNYCNKGTIKADNAYINVTIDSLMEFVSASKTVALQSGRTLRFNLGTVAADDCGTFDIIARVRCGDSTRLGQTLCMAARVFPDTICVPTTTWSGANMVVSGVCQGDSVLFQIRNTGTAPSSVLKSIVIEDEVLFFTQPVQLPQNGVFTKKFPANGHTWRMVVNQEPNHPTSTNPTAFVEACRANTNLPISTGFAPLFPNDDIALSVDMDCHQIVGSYDPNDKMGYPIGYKTEHYVAQNQDIEYTIRFQNTGTDTAFTVVIRDTISDKLDISSIEFGASSHVYTPEIYGKGILKFTFNNIKLVDSFRNEVKSHGFVQYRIKQQKDLAFGTQIFNAANIYFDFNEPIVTNKTKHTVGGKDIILAVFEKNEVANMPILVSPNPFTETAIFEAPLSISADFELYDMTGKVLRKDRFEGQTFEFRRKEMGAGVYLFKISSNGHPLSIGKLIVF